MTKRLRIIGMVAIALTILTGSVSAYSNDEKVIDIIDNSAAKTYYTKAETVKDLFEEYNIEIFEGDRIFVDENEITDMTTVLKTGNDVSVKRAYPIDVIIDGVTYKTLVTNEKVMDIEAKYADILGDNYERKSNYLDSSPVRKEMVLEYATTRYEVEVVKSTIPFETEYVDNPEIPYGEFKVIQEGANGVKSCTYTRKYVNGKYVALEESSEVVCAPSNKIIERAPGFVSIYDIGDIKYSRTMEMNVTAYTPYCDGVNNITASGTQARRGICAVDTSVLPFGTKIFIPGYGVAVAEDRGGAIKGNKLDVFMDTLAEAKQWGRKNLTVYILE